MLDQAEDIIDIHEIRFRSGSFAHMQSAVVLLREAGGDAALHREDITQASPGSVNALRLQTLTNHLDELIGRHRDEQMAIGALLLRMEALCSVASVSSVTV